MGKRNGSVVSPSTEELHVCCVSHQGLDKFTSDHLTWVYVKPDQLLNQCLYARPKQFELSP